MILYQEKKVSDTEDVLFRLISCRILMLCQRPLISLYQTLLMQSKVVQFLGGEMFYRLCRLLLAQDPWQARGEVCHPLCPEVLEGVCARRNQISRA